MYQVGRSQDWNQQLPTANTSIKLYPLQKAIVACNLKHDVLVNLPTGYGKSMLYQYPCLFQRKTHKITIVFVPLRALLWDAVIQGKKLGLRAAQLDTPVFDSIFNFTDPPHIVFLTPEKYFLNMGVQQCIKYMFENNMIDKFVIDEAHCISQWGNDFRPDYGKLTLLRKYFPNIRILAMTATAPPIVRKELIEKLSIGGCYCFQASFNRPNLTYRVLQTQKSDLKSAVLGIVNSPKYQDKSGIVYCQTIVLAQKLCTQLSNFVSCALFHSKVKQSVRQARLKDFKDNKIRVVVATICFGMGINKANVSFVIHAGVSLSVENYYQQSGRAGRDGAPAECFLLSYPNQQSTLHYLVQKSSSDKYLAQQRFSKIKEMTDYANSYSQCRKVMMFRLLGQDFPVQSCNQTCDTCLRSGSEAPEDRDITELALKIMRTLSSIHGVTKKRLASVLRAKNINNDAKVEQILSLKGSLKNVDEQIVNQYINQMLRLGLLKTITTKAKFGYYFYLQTAKKPDSIKDPIIIKVAKNNILRQSTVKATNFKLDAYLQLKTSQKDTSQPAAESEDLIAKYLSMQEGKMVNMEAEQPQQGFEPPEDREDKAPLNLYDLDFLDQHPDDSFSMALDDQLDFGNNQPPPNQSQQPEQTVTLKRLQIDRPSGRPIQKQAKLPLVVRQKGKSLLDQVYKQIQNQKSDAPKLKKTNSKRDFI